MQYKKPQIEGSLHVPQLFAFIVYMFFHDCSDLFSATKACTCTTGPIPRGDEACSHSPGSIVSLFMSNVPGRYSYAQQQ